MKAYVYREYGSPDVLRLSEIDTPVPSVDDILVRVLVTTVTATDCTFRRGEPRFSRLFTGLARPKNPVLGSEFGGRVEAVGEHVPQFAVGDEVVGTMPGNGAWAEYVALPAAGATLARKTPDLELEDAVACCDGFLTALPFLRDRGRVRRGDEVLINGASGSVGSAAVQLARHMDAVVTGVCSEANADLVRSLGAAHVVDYRRDDFTRANRTYDVIFDTVGTTTFSRCRRVLKPSGRYLQARFGPGILPAVIGTRLFGGRKALIMATGLRPPDARSADLAVIQGLAGAGSIVPVVDRRFRFEDMVDANEYVDTGRKRGNVVISLNANRPLVPGRIPGTAAPRARIPKPQPDRSGRGSDRSP